MGAATPRPQATKAASFMPPAITKLNASSA
jgi:hypothetical protein